MSISTRIRTLSLVASLLLPAAAIAQDAQPITLSPQETQQIMNEIAQRDPVIKFLLQKQQAAQASAKGESKPPNQDAPETKP